LYFFSVLVEITYCLENIVASLTRFMGKDKGINKTDQTNRIKGIRFNLFPLLQSGVFSMFFLRVCALNFHMVHFLRGREPGIQLCFEGSICR
jgi:hypothetical protein